MAVGVGVREVDAGEDVGVFGAHDVEEVFAAVACGDGDKACAFSGLGAGC